MSGYGDPDGHAVYADGPAVYADDDRPISGRQVALIDLLDRLLSGGVVLTGDLVLSVADIDLVRVSLRAVIVAVREQMDEQWALDLPGRAPLEGDGTDDGPGPPV
ncbi:gas vesicle protein [Streptomyces scabiei]|uniref:gas vesicle protein n=1 Tax=Streptomyces scabiei TaxID=1930 RepID=UPI0029907430|nr:gas vesicle protein [Streptomyces scabiei]MDW8806915.1 gas vesicle protein [Streptomyces scabiei]